MRSAAVGTAAFVLGTGAVRTGSSLASNTGVDGIEAGTMAGDEGRGLTADKGVGAKVAEVSTAGGGDGAVAEKEGARPTC